MIDFDEFFIYFTTEYQYCAVKTPSDISEMKDKLVVGKEPLTIDAFTFKAGTLFYITDISENNITLEASISPTVTITELSFNSSVEEFTKKVNFVEKFSIKTTNGERTTSNFKESC